MHDTDDSIFSINVMCVIAAIKSVNPFQNWPNHLNWLNNRQTKWMNFSLFSGSFPAPKRNLFTICFLVFRSGHSRFCWFTMHQQWLCYSRMKFISEIKTAKSNFCHFHKMSMRPFSSSLWKLNMEKSETITDAIRKWAFAH